MKSTPCWGRRRVCLALVVALIVALDPARVQSQQSGALPAAPTGVFSGHWVSAFEESTFFPCPASRWFAPSDTDGRRRTWVAFTTAGRQSMAKRTLPKGGEMFFKDSAGNAVVLQGYTDYFVRWRGTIDGLGPFGLMGIASYQIRVDSVLAIETPHVGDCDALSKPGGGFF